MTVLVELSSDDKALKIKIEGRLDMHTQPELRRAYKDIQHPLEQCTVDLLKTTYMDSGGLSMLLVMKDFLVNRGMTAKVELKNPNETIRRYLEVSKLEDTFVIN